MKASIDLIYTGSTFDSLVVFVVKMSVDQYELYITDKYGVVSA